jgi:aminoglycoside phosphotransferase family enzyme/predicted kinase
MQQEELYTLLSNPALYPDKPKKVTTIHTHISFVILTGRYAYKVKKPVNFGFLDFSTLKKRKHYCQQEIKLNRRLSKDIYLDVVPITRTDNARTDKGIKLGGKGKVIDYAVKMRQLPQAAIMTEQLRKGKVTRAAIARLAKIIANFHKSAATNKRIADFGTLKSFKRNTDENFAQTRAFIGKTITASQFRFIRTNTDRFLKNKALFRQRIRQKRIRDCHGDLHSGNVFLAKTPRIFDCIEFNERFRYGDISLDVAFMAMDLEFLGKKTLSDHFVSEYIRFSGDHGLLKVLDFYKCYRAYVRGKVVGFLLNDRHLGKAEKAKAAQEAKKYFQLAETYAHSFAPTLYLTAGLPGTGKSYEAKQLAKSTGARIIRLDKLRKEMTRTRGKSFVGAYRGIYSQKVSRKAYRAAVDKAVSYLNKGKSVIIDATFQKRMYRDWARKAAKDSYAGFMMVYVRCRDSVIRKRFKQRFRRKSVSDGRWSVYKAMKEKYEPLGKKEPHLRIDTSVGTNAMRDHILKTPRNRFFQ